VKKATVWHDSMGHMQITELTGHKINTQVFPGKRPRRATIWAVDKKGRTVDVLRCDVYTIRITDARKEAEK
jgi:hypothetical protein